MVMVSVHTKNAAVGKKSSL